MYGLYGGLLSEMVSMVYNCGVYGAYRVNGGTWCAMVCNKYDLYGVVCIVHMVVFGVLWGIIYMVYVVHVS